MDDRIKVVVLGTGQMGSGIVKLLLRKGGLALVGVYARRAQREGLDLGQALGFRTDRGIPITNDLAGLLRRTPPHLASNPEIPGGLGTPAPHVQDVDVFHR